MRLFGPFLPKILLMLGMLALGAWYERYFCSSAFLCHCSVGYQGADCDSEQLALTWQLFDAALGDLAVVARGRPCLIVGDFKVEPTKIPCLSKGISAGLWVDLEAAWLLVETSWLAVH